MLSDGQVEFIRREIEDSGLSFPALEEDLLDHFCCFIEHKMSRGLPFDTAYAIAREQICPNGFREIQEETVYLLNASKIMAMKKFMYIIGLITAISFSVGWLFTLLRWTGGQELFNYGFLGFTLIFLPMLAIDRYKVSIAQALSERLKIILGFSSAIITALAVIFKMMHLQGANILLVLGILLFSFGFLPFFFFRMYKKSTAK